MVSLSLLLTAKSEANFKGGEEEKRSGVDRGEGGEREKFLRSRGKGDADELEKFGNEESSQTPSSAEAGVSREKEISDWTKSIAREDLQKAFGSKLALEAAVPEELISELGERHSDSQASFSLLPIPSFVASVARAVGDFGEFSSSRLHIEPVDLIRDLDCVMGDENQLKQLLSRAQPLSEKAVGDCLGAIVVKLERQEPPGEIDSSTSQGIYEALLTNFSFPENSRQIESEVRTLPRFRVDSFTRTVAELKPELNWDDVIRSMDSADSVLTSSIGFDVLAEAYTSATGRLIPANLLLGQWRNRVTQFTLLTAAVASEGKRLNWELLGDSFLVEWNLPPIDRSSSVFMWRILPLIKTLIDLQHELGPTEKVEVRSLLEIPVKECPETIAVGIASVVTKDPSFQKELLAQVMRSTLMSSAYHNAVLKKIWELQPSFVFSALMILYNKEDRNTIARIFDILQELKVMDKFLSEIANFSIALDLAVLASEREFLKLEKWVKDTIAKHGRPFIDACISYLDNKTQSLRADTFPTEAATIILKCLSSCIANRSMPPELVNDLERLYNSYTERETRRLPPEETIGNSAMRIGPQLGDSLMDQGNVQFFDPMIDEEANSYFSKVYAGQITIEEAVRLLLRFKVSQNPREVDIFNCMIHNLLDEYRFFPQYPLRELQITGKLFGALVRHQVFSSVSSLRYALWCVQDALQKTPPGNLTTIFGLGALEQFRNRLHEWPSYSEQILQIPHLRQSAPELIAYIEDMLRASQEPDEETKDRIHFIFNNLDRQNVDQKAGELKEAVPDEYLEFLAKYIVEKRAAIEPNFLELYVELVERYNRMDPKLLPLVLTRSYENVRGLLGSDRIRQNSTRSSEGAALKNLGTWIGNLTLGRNKPILAKDIELKELVLDAYSEGRLMAAVPFTCQVLDACKKSKIFRPPNPWVTAILGLLRELTTVRDLKMNLRYSIEILCKNINVDLKEIKATDILKTRRQPQKVDNPDFTVRNPAPPQVPPAASSPTRPELSSPTLDIPVPELASPTLTLPRATGPMLGSPTERPLTGSLLGPSSLVLPSSVPSALHSTQASPGASSPAAASVGVSGASSVPGGTVIPNLGRYLTVNPSLPLFQQYPHLRRLLPIAIDTAVREIIQPVVRRSCTIACITTRELILKDFAQEPDVNKIMRAAHQMVEYLAGALALVTCKDPLRVRISTNLRGLLAQSGVDQNVLEQTVNVVTAENLELCCLIVERAGLQKAAADIDDYLTPELLQKQRQIQRDAQAQYGAYSDLQPQMTVYDDFLRLPRIPNNVFASATSPLGTQSPPNVQRQPSPLNLVGNSKPIGKPATPHMPAPSAPLPKAQSQPLPTMSPPPVQQNEPPLSTQQVLERFNNIYPTLVTAIQVNHPSGQEVQSLWTQIPGWVRRSTTADEAGMAVAQKVFQRLFEGESALHREVHVAILETLRESCRRLPKELVSWLAYSDEQRKFDRECIVALIKPGTILNITEYDGHLAKAIDNGRNATALDFSAFLVRKCIIEESLATPAELFGTLEVLQKLGAKVNPPATPAAPEGLLALVEAARLQGSRAVPVPEARSVEGSLSVEQFTSIMEEWRSMGSRGTPDQPRSRFPQRMRAMLESEEGREKFCQVGVEVVLENAEQLLAMRDEEDSMEGRAASPYAMVDSFASLIAAIYLESKNIVYLEVALDELCKTIRARVGNGLSGYRPHFRLFSNLMAELSSSFSSGSSLNDEMRSGEGSENILRALKYALDSVKPQVVPGFVFSWLELISSKHFMPHILSAKQTLWFLFESLLVDMLSFLNPYLQASALSDSIRMLYEGTLRLLLVLLHDLPEFLCGFHFTLCDVIPSNCIQLRNLILSAFPRAMRLPDPFMHGLKVDKLPEMAEPPNVLSDYKAALARNNLKTTLDNHLKSRAPASMLVDLKARLKLPVADAVVAGTTYNVPAINAFVFYVGQHAMGNIGMGQAINRTPHMELFQHLTNELDAEGRYHFMNAIANQLRYPNYHTHYFSRVLLYLFADAKQEIIQEQITRVLVERCLANKPHPWGLLLTFIELIKNPRYNFWTYSFVRCAPEIERLFENVAQSCIGALSHSPRDDVGGISAFG